MTIFKTDQLFEEAARSAESCEKLIKRLRRERMSCLMIVLGTVVITGGFGVWGLVLANRAFQMAIKGLSPSPDTSLGSIASVVTMFTPVVLVLIVMELALILHHDACIKMLLFMRAQQTHPAATGDDIRSAPASPLVALQSKPRMRP